MTLFVRYRLEQRVLFRRLSYRLTLPDGSVKSLHLCAELPAALQTISLLRMLDLDNDASI
jgi:hypothetical protein